MVRVATVERLFEAEGSAIALWIFNVVNRYCIPKNEIEHTLRQIEDSSSTLWYRF
jgi:hypothetical protein